MLEKNDNDLWCNKEAKTNMPTIFTLTLANSTFEVPTWNEEETMAQWLRRIAPFLKGVKIWDDHGHQTLVA